MLDNLKNVFLIDILLESELVGTVLCGYLFLLFVVIVSFVNIYSTDKVDFLYNNQKCINFKHKALFIIQKSQNKKVVSIKTFVLELIGYIIFIPMMFSMIYGLFLEIKNSIILLGINAILIFSFGIVTAVFYRKSKKQNYNS